MSDRRSQELGKNVAINGARVLMGFIYVMALAFGSTGLLTFVAVPVLGKVKRHLRFSPAPVL